MACLSTGAALALSLAWAVTALKEEAAELPTATPGQVVDARSGEDPLPHPARVRLPWQQVDLAVGTPQPRLPDLGTAPADLRPPVGGSFVRVDSTSTPDPLPFVGVSRPLKTTVEVVLRADGQEYPVSGPGGLRYDPNTPWTTQTRTRWVAVDGTPEDVELAVVVDGREQTVRSDGSVDLGQAAGLAALPDLKELSRQVELSCGEARRTDRSELELEKNTEDPTCRVKRTVRTPFVDGLGWAQEGNEFLTVVVALDRTVRLERSEDHRWLPRLRTHARLGGADPAAGPIDVNALNSGTLVLQDRDQPDMFVFEVGEGSSPDLDLQVDIDAQSTDPFTRRSDRLRFEWTIPGEELS